LAVKEEKERQEEETKGGAHPEQADGSDKKGLNSTMTDQEQIGQTIQEDEYIGSNTVLDMSWEKNFDKNVKVVLISVPEEAELA